MKLSDIDISFCTTCSNRLYQLASIFESNANIISHDSKLEWVIVNMNSQDDLHNWMLGKLSSQSHRVIYANDLSHHPWHLSVAKNKAHRIASGKILMNIDCDNYIGNAVDVIRDYFNAGCQLLHMWSGVNRDGTCGRIAINQSLYYKLGGYDESFHPMGFQDRDLLNRASALGVPVIQHQCADGYAIKNTKDESIRYCKIDNLTWQDYDRLNRARSAENIMAGRFVANTVSPWSELKVTLMKGEIGD